ncbi:hypothetical protein BKA69DRAFT_1071304 [Paraphysoderma sedebokerense]|nr:hypothetical protein BKA69DRAFT_1071304 [Paraphysoderma sedebokerense]
MSDKSEISAESYITVTSLNGTFQGKKILNADHPITIGRHIEGKPAPSNGLRFNTKVVSRQHARILKDKSKFWVQDTKSSSGTFLNKVRLSAIGQESELKELKDGDIIQLGEDYNQNGVLHHCVVLKVQLPLQTNAELQSQKDESMALRRRSVPLDQVETPYVDYADNNEVRENVANEFNSVWTNITHDIPSPIKRIRTASLFKDTNKSLSLSPQHQKNNSPTLVRNSNVSSSSSSSSLTPKSPGFLTFVDLDDIHTLETFVHTQSWPTPDHKTYLLQLTKMQDTKLLALFKSLKSFPTAFADAAIHYVETLKFQQTSMNLSASLNTGLRINSGNTPSGTGNGGSNAGMMGQSQQVSQGTSPS